MMLIIPAVDIRGGRTVRLIRGEVTAEVVYQGDPVAWAARWIGQGAPWLHVVDLDGALAGHPVHLDLLRRVCALGVPVQAGGGFRTMADVHAALAAGAARVILGTGALALAPRLGRFADRVAVSLDVREGMIALRGWTEQTAVAAVEVAARLRDDGIRRFIYTDITRDGALNGPNAEALRGFVAGAGVPVIAAGGITVEDDLAELAVIGVEGVVVGRALYEGRLDLAAAIHRWSRVPC